MKLSFKFKPSISKKQLEIVEELSYHTTKLYNIINYDLRENGVKTYYDIEKEYKSNWHCDFLHSHTRQQMFKVLEQNWKSYMASRRIPPAPAWISSESPNASERDAWKDSPPESVFTLRSVPL